MTSLKGVGDIKSSDVLFFEGELILPFAANKLNDLFESKPPHFLVSTDVLDPVVFERIRFDLEVSFHSLFSISHPGNVGIGGELNYHSSLREKQKFLLPG